MADSIRDDPAGGAYGSARRERAARTRAPAEHAPEEEVAPREYFPAAIRRISWGAILAGAVVALVLQLLFNLFGVAAGLGAIDPATEEAPFSGLGLGTGIWLVVSSIIALFVGGWTAGRFAGLPRRVDGLLHGFVTWAVTTFVIVYLAASGVGAIFGGAFSVMQEGTDVLARGAGIALPEVAEQIEGEASAEEIRQEIADLLRQTGREDLQPENLAAQAQQAADTVGQAAEEAAQAPADAEEEIRNAFDRLIAMGQETVSEVDREAVVNVLVARTDMSREEAQQTVKEYEATAEQARQQLQQAGEQATQTADQVIASVSRAALWTAIAMVVGAVAAAGGGATGAPADLPASPAVRRE